jgi:hypothetical protein
MLANILTDKAYKFILFMLQKITELIKYGAENACLDFKEIQYSIEKHPIKNEILKDISAMANHPSDEDKFIIVGVREESGVVAGLKNISDVIDEAKYQQFVNSNIEPPITFEYRSIMFEGANLAFFRIFNNKNRPYLFKKELSNPTKPEKNEFRIGDGYIRQGTSTRKMTRDDFELIYHTKLSAKDRRPDIKVTPYISNSLDEEINSYNLSCFDVSVQNLSSKSIDFDMEIKFLKSGKFKIIEEAKLKKELNKKQSELIKYQQIYPFINPTPYPLPSFMVSLKETGSYFIATRDKRLGERTAISIAQHDIEHQVFCGELVVLCDPDILIQGEITIRSDEFLNGPLILPFSIKHHP